MEDYKRYIDYIEIAGGSPKVEWFISDWEPIGEILIRNMELMGLIEVSDGVIKLREEK